MSVWALDGLDRIDTIADYRTLTYSSRDMLAGDWTITLPLGDGSSAASQLLAADYPGLEVFDPSTRERFAGFLTDFEIVEQAGQPTLVTLSGLDFQGWLQGWLAWPDSGNVQRWWNLAGGDTLSLTTAIHNQAVFTFGASALAERQMPDVSGIGSNDPDAGPAPSWLIEGQPILELFREWCTGTDYTFRLELDRTSDSASLLFSTPARGVAPRTYGSGDLGFAAVRVKRSAALGTRAIAMGADDPAPTETGDRVVSDQQGFGTDWTDRYWEVFRDRGSSPNQAELDDETANWLTSMSATASARIADAVVPGWGTELQLGWKVNVRAGQTVTETTVTEATVTGTPEGFTRTVSFGDGVVSPETLLAQRLAAVSARLARAERQGERT